MKDAIGKIGENYNELKAYLNKIIESEDIKQYEKEFNNEINNLSMSLDKDLKFKQNILDVLKQKFKSYYDYILSLYENSFIKIIKEYNQKLFDLMDKIIIEFEPPKENSLLCSDKNRYLSTSENSIELENNKITDQFDSNNFYEDLLDSSSSNKNDKDKRENNADNKQNKKIEYFCFVCSKEEAIYFCDKCNQLFCQECFEFIKQNDNSNNKCEHNTQKISDLKGQNEKGKILYLSSVNILSKVF